MGYHLGASGKKLADGVWSDVEQRKKIYEYCPEIKMILDMKLEREKCTQEDYDRQKAEKEKKEAEEAEKAKSSLAAAAAAAPTPAPAPAPAKVKKRSVEAIPIAMW